MHLHFIGIAGSAMGSVAVACKAAGHTVTGSDVAVYPPMSDVLASAGVEFFDSYDGDRLRMLAPDLVVVGNAISRGNPEVEVVLDDRMTMTSMAELVGSLFISRNTSIVCAGTHGKTTTSSMTAWILDQSMRKPGFLIGGVPKGLDVGCRTVPPDVHDTYGGIFVVEGDEYDTAFFDKRSKFVHYRPTIAILNNLEFDHADIFENVHDIVRSFEQLIRIIPQHGRIFVNADDTLALTASMNGHTPVSTVGMSPHAAYRITDIQYNDDHTSWTIVHGERSIGHFTIGMAGEHNVRNATMAIAACLQVDVTIEEAAAALATFKPPKRRLERIGEWHGCVVIDDFAHHPTAISATIRALRSMFPKGSIHAVFEPRSNTTSRNIFQQELGSCFDGATTVCIGPVNRPERYAAEERLDTRALVETLLHRGISARALHSDYSQHPDWGSEILPWLSENVKQGDVIVVLSNGNAGGLRSMLAAP